MGKEIVVKNTYTGPGLITLLTILFVGLKLTGYISWSWWWVLSPLWISTLGVLAVVIIVVLVALVLALLEK